MPKSAAACTARDANRGKVDTAGGHVRQIELCLPHRQIVIECGRTGALKICDRRDEKSAALQLEEKKRASAPDASPKPTWGRGLSNPASQIKPLTGAAALAPHSAPHRPRRRRHDLFADYRIRDVEAYRVVIVVFNYERKRVAARQAEVR
jgi:hypothetical protein